jgi:predicted dehydrogenase
MVSIYLGQDWVDLHSDTWRMDPSLSGGGQLYDTGSHVLDALLWTTGTRPVSVGAQISVEKSRVDINSALSLQLEESDTQITASVGISGDGVDVDPTEGYVYWGTDGRLDYTNGRLTVAEKEGMTYQTEITEGIDFQTLNKRKLENFISSMQGTVDPAVPGEFGLQVTALTEAAYQAAETGSVVSVRSLIETAYADRDGS